MARSGINKKDVWEAASKLQERGVEPTIERLRAELGTGSNTTISKFFKEWREFNDSLNDNGLLRKTPLSLPSQLQSMADTFWKTAQTQAEQEIAIIKEEAHQTVLHAETLLEEEARKIKALQEKLQLAEEALTHQAEIKGKLSMELAQERQAKAVLKSQVIALGDHLAQQKEENAKLHQLSQSLQRNWEHLETTSQEQQEKLKSELENIRQQSDHQIKQITVETQQLSQEKHLLQIQLEELKGNYNQFKSENLELHKQIECKALENDSLKKKLEQVNDENLNLQKQINESKDRLRAVEIQQAGAVADNMNLSEAINQLKGKVQFLESKNQELNGEKHHLQGRLQQLQNALIINA